MSGGKTTKMSMIIQNIKNKIKELESFDRFSFLNLSQKIDIEYNDYIAISKWRAFQSRSCIVSFFMIGVDLQTEIMSENGNDERCTVSVGFTHQKNDFFVLGGHNMLPKDHFLLSFFFIALLYKDTSIGVYFTIIILFS